MVKNTEGVGMVCGDGGGGTHQSEVLGVFRMEGDESPHEGDTRLASLC